MHSQSDRDAEPEVKSGRRLSADTVEAWNRKLHYYLGLYFLLFLWLFSLTGLLLNNSGWRFAQFWPQRKETRYEMAIEATPAGSELARARDVMRQLNLVGEIDWPKPIQMQGRLDFSVNRPGKTNQVSVDLVQKRATVQRIDINSWGVVHVLHTFSGVRFNNPSMERDWLLTTIWVVSMDALAAGLLIMVLSSYYMWYRLKPKRKYGLLALSAGILSCGFIAAGLAWLDRLR